jgi:hypothetical protein
VDEGVDEGVVDVVDEERVLQRVKMQVFRPPTWAVFGCKLDVQIEVDSKHAKVMFQIQICPERSMRKYIEFGNKQTQNHVYPIASL